MKRDVKGVEEALHTHTAALCCCKRALLSKGLVCYRKPYSSMLLAQEFKQKEARVFWARARYKWERVKRGGTVRHSPGGYGSDGREKGARMNMGKVREINDME